MEHIQLFYILLLLVAFLYASVGHGGASGYLALMAIFSFTPEVMKPTALMLNLFVSAISFYQFYRAKHFIWKIFLPLALASVPMAYLGGMISVDAGLYKKLLGLILLVPICRFAFFPENGAGEFKQPNAYLSILMGAFIGFISGLIGIGGGIILSPLILLLKWTDQKQTAAISALFIFVNSIAGLAGQYRKGIEFTADMWAYVLVAAIGGICGAFFGAVKFKQGVLKQILAWVLLAAALKLLLS